MANYNMTAGNHNLWSGTVKTTAGKKYPPVFILSGLNRGNEYQLRKEDAFDEIIYNGRVKR